MNKLRLFNKISASKNDNKGSVLVTVLVAFLFISVLVAIVLSTVSVNVKMRFIDSKTKDEFYYAEEALNDIYTGVGQDCSNIITKRYNIILNQYKDGTNHTYLDQNKAYESFVDGFVTTFRNNYTVSGLETKFNNFIVKDPKLKDPTATVESRAMAKLDSPVCVIKYYKDIERENEIADSDLSNRAKDVRTIVIKNVSVISNPAADENIGYVSKITTDIVINIPWIDFFNLNKSGFDFALTANGGVYVENNANLVVDGNMFAGTDNFAGINSNTLPRTTARYDEYPIYRKLNDSSKYGGININGGTVNIKNADYVISGGDINLMRESADSVTKSSLTIEPNSKLSNQIWFENLECKNIGVGDPLKSGIPLYEVNITGNTFAAGDLQVDGNFAKVKLSGSYYGYNNGSDSLSIEPVSGTKLYTKEAKYKTDNYNKADEAESISARSSSVIVNGRDDTVTFDNMKTMMIMGSAYINHESNATYDDATGTTEGIIVDPSGNIKTGELPENVALKGSQIVLYVPAEFIEDTNPMRYAGGQTDPFQDVIDQSITTKDWFGKKYINNTKPYKIIKMKNTYKHPEKEAMTYAYCYLNFKDEEVDVPLESGGSVRMSCKDAYVYELIQGKNNGTEPEPTAETLKKRLLQTLSVYNSKVILKKDPDFKLYSSSSVVANVVSDPSANPDLDTIEYVLNTDYSSNATLLNMYSTNLYKRYRLMDTYLETLKNESLSSTDVQNSTIERYDVLKDGHEMPFARFFWLKGLDNAVSIGKCESYDLDGDKLVLIRTSSRNPWDEINLIGLRDQNNELVFNGNKQNVIVLADGPIRVGGKRNGAVSNSDTNSGTVEINGFLATTSTITVNSGSTLKVTYDSGVINRRISKELDILRKVGGFHDGTGDSYELMEDIPEFGYSKGDTLSGGNPGDNDISRKLLSYYLLRTDVKTFAGKYDLKHRTKNGDIIGIPASIGLTKEVLEGLENTNPGADKIDTTLPRGSTNYYLIPFYRMYRFDGKTVEDISNKVNTEYTSYMYFDNWKKGQ